MGTRGNILIKESENGCILVNMYRHMDSYPSGLGYDLDQFLFNRLICNGISLAPQQKRYSNGIDDLAAQLVTLLKGKPENSGGLYICRPESPLNDPNDYTYIIYPVTKTKETVKVSPTARTFEYEDPTGPIMVEVYKWSDRMFRGTTDKFHAFITKQCKLGN
jgi:hypothetical protein